MTEVAPQTGAERIIRPTPPPSTGGGLRSAIFAIRSFPPFSHNFPQLFACPCLRARSHVSRRMDCGWGPRLPPPDTALPSRVVLPQNGQFLFDSIGFKARYNVLYRLRFTLDPVAGLPVADAWSDPIEAQRCGNRDFYVPGETVCRACLPGAVCNGTSVDRMRTQAGYWRAHPDTLAFVRCPEWLPEGTCMANFTQGTCAGGHTGFLCGTCKAGHGGIECTRCYGGFEIAKLVAFIAIYLAIFGWTTVRAYIQDAHSKRLLTISAWKRAIGFFQTLGVLASCFIGMPWLQTVFEQLGNVTSFAFPKKAMECVFALSAVQLFCLYMALPSIRSRLPATARSCRGRAGRATPGPCEQPPVLYGCCIGGCWCLFALF